MGFTCPQHREEEEPEQTDDWSGKGLIDSSQVYLSVEASRQVRKVQIVFVHQVLQGYIQKTCICTQTLYL